MLCQTPTDPAAHSRSANTTTKVVQPPKQVSPWELCARNRLEVKTVEGGHRPGAYRTSALPDPGTLQSSWVSRLVHSTTPNQVLSL